MPTQFLFHLCWLSRRYDCTNWKVLNILCTFAEQWYNNKYFYFIKPTPCQSFDGTAQSCLGSEGIKTFANIGRYSSWSEWIQIICLPITINRIFDHRYLNLIGYFYFCLQKKCIMFIVHRNVITFFTFRFAVEKLCLFWQGSRILPYFSKFARYISTNILMHAQKI